VLNTGPDQGAIYGSVTSIFGTPPGEPRHLWLTVLNLICAFCASLTATPTTTRLVPVMDDGSIGAPLFSQLLTKSTDTGTVRGWAVSRNAAWISDGDLVWRWTGTELDVTPISIGGLPTGTVRGVWAASADDAWILGETLYPKDGLPLQTGAPRGMAAHYKGGPATDGGQP
jgi:hypothetical protein